MSSYWTGSRQRGEHVEVELEDAPGSLQQRPGAARRASPPPRARRCPGRGTASGALDRELDLAARRERLDRRPSRAAKPPCAIPPTCSRSSGSSSPAAGRRARSRRARSARSRRVRSAPRRRRSPCTSVCAARPARPRSARAAPARRVGRRRHEPRRVRLGQPGADERRPRRAGAGAARRERAAHRAAHGQRERDLVEAEPRDLLDHVDLARHVAARATWAPSRPSVSTSKPRPRAGPRCSSAGVSSPISRPRARAGSRTTGRPGSSPWTSFCAEPARAGELDEQLGRERRRLRREVRIDALLPAVRAFRAQREPLGGAQDPVRLEVRRLEQHLARSSRGPRSPRRP